MPGCSRVQFVDGAIGVDNRQERAENMKLCWRANSLPPHAHSFPAAHIAGAVESSTRKLALSSFGHEL